MGDIARWDRAERYCKTFDPYLDKIKDALHINGLEGPFFLVEENNIQVHLAWRQTQVFDQLTVTRTLISEHAVYDSDWPREDVVATTSEELGLREEEARKLLAEADLL